MDLLKTQPMSTGVVMSTTSAITNTSAPTSVYQHVIVQPSHLVQVPKPLSHCEDNNKSNGVVCKYLLNK